MGNFMPATAPPARGQEDTKELLLMCFLLPPNQTALPAWGQVWPPFPIVVQLWQESRTCSPSFLSQPYSTDTKAHLEKGLEKPSLAEHHTRLQGGGGLQARSGWSCRN